MFKKAIYFLLILFAGNVGIAQDKYCAVFATEGVSVKCRKGFQPVENGQFLKKNAVLKLGENARLIVMDGEGRLLTFWEEGELRLKKVDFSKFGEASSFVLDLWTGFYQRARSFLQNPETINRNYIMGLDRPVFEVSQPSSVQIYGNQALIRWSDIGDKTYMVTLKNEFDETIYSQKVNDTSLLLDLLDERLAWKSAVTFTVSGLESRRYAGTYVLDKQSPPDRDTTADLLKKLPGDNTLAGLLTRAVFFEMGSLYADALLVYETMGEEQMKQTRDFYNAYFPRNGFYAISLK